MKKVSDIMTSDVISVTPDVKVAQIARLLVDNHLTGVPVVDEHGIVLGIITEEDLIVRVAKLHVPEFVSLLGAIVYLGSEKKLDEEVMKVLATTAGDLVHTEKTTSAEDCIGQDASIETLATLMLERNVNPVPVIDHASKLVGIVSRSDLVKQIAEQG